MKVGDIYYYGEITIVNKTMGTYKVFFDDGDGPDYWYYPESALEAVEMDDTDE